MYGEETEKKPGGLYKIRFPPKTERVQYQKRTRCLSVTKELDQRGNERKERKKLIVVDSDSQTSELKNDVRKTDDVMKHITKCIP